jgi:hypothetical protein
MVGLMWPKKQNKKGTSDDVPNKENLAGGGGILAPRNSRARGMYARLAARFTVATRYRSKCGHSKPAELSSKRKAVEMLALCALVKRIPLGARLINFSNYVMYVMYVTWTFSAYV